MPSSILFGLIACNIVWACNPVFSKVLLQDFHPLQVAWLRYGSAFLAFLLVPFFRKFSSSSLEEGEGESRPLSLGDGLSLVLIGLGAFFMTPALQITGLHSTQALDNVLIVVMEPLVSVLLAGLILRQKMTRSQVVSMGLSLFGFALMSGLGLDSGREILGRAVGSRSWGNILILLSLSGEALYTVLGSKLVSKLHPLKLFGTSLGAGLLALSGLVFGVASFPAFDSLRTEQVLAVLWIGPLGTTLTYSYWAWALGKAPVASVALTLFVQPVCGVLLAFFALGERFSLAQTVGAAIIVLTVSWPMLKTVRRFLVRLLRLGQKNQF